MALTLTQKANDVGLNTYYPHQVGFPTWFIASSDIVDSYFNFKYKFKIYDDTNTLIKTVYVNPDENGLGALDISTIAATFDTYSLPFYGLTAPEGTLTDWFNEYSVKVSEYYNNTEYNETTYTKSLMCGATSDAYIDDYFLNLPLTTSFYYTMREPDVIYSEAFVGRGSISLLNGSTDTLDSDLKGVEYRFVYANGDTRTYQRDISYGNATFNPAGALESQSLLGVHIQTSIKGLDGMDFDLTAVNGSPSSGSEVIPDIEDIVSYEVEFFDNTDTLFGDIFKFKVLPTCNEEPVNIIWKNPYGTFDYFPFIAQNDNVVESNKTTYKHFNIYKTSTTYSYNRYLATYESEESTLDNKIEYKQTFRTHFLTVKESELLESLWISDEMKLSYSDSKYMIPIVSLKNVQKTKNKAGFFQYTLEATFAKILNK